MGWDVYMRDRAMGVRRISSAGRAVGLCGQDAGALKRWGLIVLST